MAIRTNEKGTMPTLWQAGKQAPQGFMPQAQRCKKSQTALDIVTEIAYATSYIQRRRRPQPMKVNEAIAIMADKAISLGEITGSDDTGIVRAIVKANNLGFNAWFCVCCEIADRNAQTEGFKNQADRAASKMAVQS